MARKDLIDRDTPPWGPKDGKGPKAPAPPAPAPPAPTGGGKKRAVPASAGPLLTVNVRVGDRDFSRDLERDAAFGQDLNGLNAALAGNPGLYAVWATMEVMARAEVENLLGELAAAKTRLEEEEANVFQEISTTPVGTSSGGAPKYPSVEATKVGVATAPSVVRIKEEMVGIQDRLREARNIAEVLHVGVSTIKMKLDAVIEVARNIRAEMQALSQDSVSVPADTRRAEEDYDKARREGGKG